MGDGVETVLAEIEEAAQTHDEAKHFAKSAEAEDFGSIVTVILLLETEDYEAAKKRDQEWYFISGSEG